jgi:hypothetical protein
MPNINWKKIMNDSKVHLWLCTKTEMKSKQNAKMKKKFFPVIVVIFMTQCKWTWWHEKAESCSGNSQQNYPNILRP